MIGENSNRRAGIVPALRDVLIACAAFGVSLMVMFNGGVGATREGTNPAVLTAIALVAASTLPLVLGDRFPVQIFAVTCAATAVTAIAVYPIGLPIGPGVALYTIATNRSHSALSATGRTAVVVAGFAAYLGAAALHLSRVPWAEALHGSLLWAALWFAGERTRLQRQQIDDLTQAAVHERHLAAAEERTRIARDLHDSAGHAINVIAIRAGAARLRHHENPDRSLDALQSIEELARQTAADIDQFVGALRSGADDDAPPVPRSLSSVRSLVGLHAESGLDVTIRMTGTPRSLPPSVDQAAYRIVQEALTNASRHGSGSAALAIAYTHSSVDINVANPTAHTDPRPLGHGLTGATERAAQLGGTMRTVLRHGEFALHASIPYFTAAAGHQT